jgi:hypothetical protein
MRTLLDFRRAIKTKNRIVAKRSFKVVFAGAGHFESAFVFSKEALRHDEGVLVTTCKREDVRSALIDADVLVPLMIPVGETELSIAKCLKVILQFGVGLEGIPTPQICFIFIWML